MFSFSAPILALLLVSLLPSLASAANATEWRNRSIYQIIVDRFALPSGANPNVCDPGNQTWCGGTWKTIKDNLDYVQDMGFTAIWISPVSQNYEGPRTAYGDAYHGYWIADVTQLNLRFGTADDLHDLISEVHSRGMYIMVDVVVNDVMATSLTPDLSPYFFKEQSQYHKYCPVDYSNTTSEELCWLGDTVVPLPDLNTEDPTVVQGYSTWISSLIQEYDIDGLRIDAAKHVDIPFWPQFCGNATVFCIGEVDTASIDEAAEYQGPQALDSVLQYPMWGALTGAFALPGPQNISGLVDMITQSQQKMHDNTVLGNFLENQDVTRWHNVSVDIQSLFNAMVFNFMTDGIPIVYYGQEQGFSGNADPWNREPLWTSNYTKSSIYNYTATLNQLRNFLINTTTFATDKMQILTANNYSIAIQKGNAVSVMNNLGSPPANLTVPVYTAWDPSTPMTEIISCSAVSTGSNGTLEVSYVKGGVAAIFVPDTVLAGSGLCGYTLLGVNATPPALESGALRLGIPRPNLSVLSAALPVVLLVFGFWSSLL